MAAPALGAAKRPNVVLILADDLGSADLGCYGSRDISTPHVDGLTRRGVRFTRCYSNGPECSPTRSALLTGRYQQRVGGLECALGLGDVGRYDDAIWLQKRGELGLPATEYTLPRAFQKAGYDTGCFGKWHLGYRPQFWPNRHGFDEYFGILGGGADYFTHREPEKDGGTYLYRNGERVEREGYLTDIFAGEAVNWLKRRERRPFFLYLPFNAPHTPIQDPDARGTAEWRNGHRPTYAKMVERMDAKIGTVLAQLDAMGVAGNTIVVFLSDNGADANGSNGALRGRKSSLFEGGVRVPCIVRWPDALSAAGTIDQVTLTMDWFPTLLSAAGIAKPKEPRFDGIDLMPFLKSGRRASPRLVFWRSKRGDRVRKAVREGDLKYISDAGEEFVFDLAQDERESNNLITSTPGRTASLKAKLADWERDVMAPRLKPFRSEPG